MSSISIKNPTILMSMLLNGAVPNKDLKNYINLENLTADIFIRVNASNFN